MWITFCRAVYSTGLRAMPIESSDSRRIRVRDICKYFLRAVSGSVCCDVLFVCLFVSAASFFHGNPASTHRLFPWLTRELKVVVGDEHVEFMLQLIQSLIDKYRNPQLYSLHCIVSCLPYFLSPTHPSFFCFSLSLSLSLPLSLTL